MPKNLYSSNISVFTAFRLCNCVTISALLQAATISRIVDLTVKYSAVSILLLEKNCFCDINLTDHCKEPVSSDLNLSNNVVWVKKFYELETFSQLQRILKGQRNVISCYLHICYKIKICLETSSI